MRRIYNSFYGKVTRPLVSAYWIPKWCEGITDSSARNLELFEKKNEVEKLQSLK
jgi:hypothetical protein